MPPALLLVGGLGTRLKSVVSTAPKPLAPVGESPFVELLIEQLRSQGFRKIVMCTGHLADQIKDYFGDGARWDVSIEYSTEEQPLGTAGAVKLAEKYVKHSADFLVMNGDSFLEMDFGKFLQFHRQRGGIMTMAVRSVLDSARYGTVEMGADGLVVGFAEKTEVRRAGLINGGVYLFRRAVLEQIPAGAGSLEKSVFGQLLPQGVYALEQHGTFIDIGTPEDYAQAQTLYQRLREAAHSKTV